MTEYAKIKLRFGSKKDRSRLLRLLKAYRHDSQCRTSDELEMAGLCNSLLCSHFARFVIAFDKARAVGFILFTYSASIYSLRRSVQITDLWVDHQSRSSGVASKLINFVEDHARQSEIRSLYLFTSADEYRLNQFYCSRGWNEVSLRYYRKLLSKQPQSVRQPHVRAAK